MKRVLLLTMTIIVSLGAAYGQGNAQGRKAAKKFNIQSVNLITAQELEIVCATKPADAGQVYDGFTVTVDAGQVYDGFTVTVDGAKAEYTYLSCFDFGGYSSAPVINIRLTKPLDVGTLKSKTGNARTPGENTQETKGPAAAAGVRVTAGGQTVTARWKPFYDYTNIGSKSKLTATGTKMCGTTAANDHHLGVAYTHEHVVDYAAGGIHRMTGRAELLTQNAVDYGVKVVIVGPGQSVYEAPEWRELYNPADYRTRRVIEGSVEKPVIVATADDVMRQASNPEMQRAQSDFFSLGEAFARLFWRVGVNGMDDGVTLGSRRTPRSVYNEPDDFRYDKHVATAYAEAKQEKRYPGTRMMESLEDYFVYGTMIFYEFIPETADGQWQKEGGPVNTREELKRYDPALYRAMCGIFGEWEYFSSENSEGFDRGRDGVRSGMPWFWHTQVDNFDTHARPYPALDIEHVWVIAENQIEVKFNREVKDMTHLCDPANWRIEHSMDGGRTWNTVPHEMTGGYLWRAITLGLPRDTDFSFTKGYYGRSFYGFTRKDIDERRVSAGGWIADDEPVNPAALEFGQFVGIDEAVSKYGAGLNGRFRVRYLAHTPVCDWAGNQLPATRTHEAAFKPWIGNVYRSPLTGFYLYADTDVSKEVMLLSGMYYDLGLSNNLTKEYDEWPSGKPYSAEEKKTSSRFDRPGQRIADFAVKRHGGMLIVAEGQHANQQPERRRIQGGNYHSSLYVEGWGGNIFQDQANNITRDYSMTRYKNEFLLYHEGGHGIDSYTGATSYAPEVFTNITAAHDTARSEANGRRYYDENNVGSYHSARDEYVSTGTTYWHGTMRESKDGTNDGTWIPVCNRWEFYRYDPWGFEALKRLLWTGDLGLWYENRVGDPAYRVLPGDWKYLRNDPELNDYLTLRSGLHGGGETVKIDSENALIAWGSTTFETLRDDPYNRYHNPLVKWVSWFTPMIYDITVKKSTNPQFPHNNMGFKGGVLYYPDSKEPRSFLNPFLRPGGVKRPVRSPEEEALLKPVSGKASRLILKTSVLPVFTFSRAADITVDNAQTSFAVKVNGKPLGFRYFESNEKTVSLYLNWPVEPGDRVEVVVLETGQSVTARY